MTYSGLLGRFLLTDRWPAFEVLPLFEPVWLVSSVLFSEREESYAFLPDAAGHRPCHHPHEVQADARNGSRVLLAMEGIALARGDDGMVGPETLTPAATNV